MSEDWQPIETAPKDGTHIIALTRDYGAIEVWWVNWDGGSWRDGEFWMDHHDSEPNPTHWIPIPILPERKRG